MAKPVEQVLNRYPFVRVLNSYLNDKSEEQNSGITGVKLEGDIGKVDIDIENASDGPNSGTGVSIEDATVGSGKLNIDGFETNLETEDAEGHITELNSTDSNIGWKAKSGTDLSLGEVYFESRIADIVHHDNVRIHFIDEVAKNIYRETNGSLRPADIELHKQSKAILDSTSETMKREYFAKLLAMGYKGLSHYLVVRSTYEILRRRDYIDQNIPSILP